MMCVSSRSAGYYLEMNIYVYIKKIYLYICYKGIKQITVGLAQHTYEMRNANSTINGFCHMVP
jgi:hypothetical protein